MTRDETYMYGQPKESVASLIAAIGKVDIETLIEVADNDLNDEDFIKFIEYLMDCNIKF